MSYVHFTDCITDIISKRVHVLMYTGASCQGYHPHNRLCIVMSTQGTLRISQCSQCLVYTSLCCCHVQYVPM